MIARLKVLVSIAFAVSVGLVGAAADTPSAGGDPAGVRFNQQLAPLLQTYCYEAIQVAMRAVLISPHFLFKVERPRGAAAGQPMPELSDYELATRVSYFLWSSMPDDELLLMAHRGQLRDSKHLLQKVATMLRDPRSRRFVNNFAGQSGQAGKICAR